MTASLKTRAVATAMALAVMTTMAIATAPASTAATKAHVTVTTSTTSRSATTVRTTVKVTVKTARRGHAITVKVKTGAKTKNVKARWSGGAYRGVARIVTSKPATTVVKALGVTKRVKAKKVKTTVKKVYVDGRSAKPAKTVTVTAKAGSKVEISAQLTPARGRKVLVQRKTDSTWRTQATLTTRAAARVTLTATVPTSSTATTWRLYAPTTVRLAAATVATTTIKPAAGTGGSDTDNPGNPGGGGTDPGTPTPPIDWQPGQRYCFDNVTSYAYNPATGVWEGYFETRIPGCTDYGAVTVEAISTVADHYWLDNRCGVTITCWRKPTPNELSRGYDPSTPVEWSPPPTVDTYNDANPEIAYMPETVEALNQLAVEKGWITQAEIDAHGPPWREIKTLTWNQFPHSSAPGYGTVLGHGGPTLAHAASRALGRTRLGVSMLPTYSNQTTLGFHSIPGAISDQMDANYPVTPYKWSCSEQGWTVKASVHDILRRLDSAHETGLRAQVKDYIALGYRGAAYVTHGAYRWAGGAAWEWVNFCRLSNHGQTEMHPDGYTIYSPATLPGDPWS
ncbi:hypothetical protein GCM10010401_08600 [Rarobacter faecitabidus]|uniref:Uncharacterized protein n=1 Tax=Rarobacter faecitabidus TaxID=13243 RepID=A0A542ZAZ2_RARFA|nr:hypothetical protein [Rarobacter faecitabidus]TQL57461.1 hypothetical protein FB461_2198 [Rarobacter faecitabidus]